MQWLSQSHPINHKLANSMTWITQKKRRKCIDPRAGNKRPSFCRRLRTSNSISINLSSLSVHFSPIPQDASHSDVMTILLRVWAFSPQKGLLESEMGTRIKKSQRHFNSSLPSFFFRNVLEVDEENPLSSCHHQRWYCTSVYDDVNLAYHALSSIATPRNERASFPKNAVAPHSPLWAECLASFFPTAFYIASAHVESKMT